MSVLERLREGERLPIADPEEIYGYYIAMTSGIMSGVIQERRVLAANFLSEGQAGPLDQLKRVEFIEANNGWRKADDEAWANGLKAFVESFDQDLEEIIDDPGIVTICSKTSDGRGFKQETFVPVREVEVGRARYWIVVKEYDFESGQSTLLGLGISNLNPPKK